MHNEISGPLSSFSVCGRASLTAKPPYNRMNLTCSSLQKEGYQMKRFVILGLVVGAGFGLWDLIVTLLTPLAEDDPSALLLFYGPMFAIWGLAGFVAARRTGRIADGVQVAAIVAFVSFVVFDVAAIVRVNMFLEALSHRSDWQNLLVRYQASGFQSLRAYANYEYITGSPFKLLVATLIGGATGLVGGLFGWLGRRDLRWLP
jgi:hypothetical protein